MVDGEYKWTLENQGYAHRMCQDKCDQLMRMESSTVIVANTNTSKKEWQPYADMAEKYGYSVFHLVVENWHGGKDTHNVPEESLSRMEARLKNSIKLR
jgi:predicted kinase